MKILAVSEMSVTVEMESLKPFYYDREFTIVLDGKEIRKEKRNVFSLFGLHANKTYEIEAAGQEAKFQTLPLTKKVYPADFGAIGDGKTDDTDAFQKAIYRVPVNGTLMVPRGKYLLSPLFLKSDMTVYLEKGAVLLANPDYSHYQVLSGKQKSFPGLPSIGTGLSQEDDCYASLLNIISCRDVQIIGAGMIDQQNQQGEWHADYQEDKKPWPPSGIYIAFSEEVTFIGFTIRNSPAWNLHPYFSKWVHFIDLSILNSLNASNANGLVPDCCQNTEIIGTSISVGDDCIAIKSGQIDLAKKYKSITDALTIRNCLMDNGLGGVVFGPELSGGIHNVNVSRCLFRRIDRGMRIKTLRGCGHIGSVDGISFTDILMEDVKVPLVINMFYNNVPMLDDDWVSSLDFQPFEDSTPVIGKLAFKNMTCLNCAYSAGVFLGLPESPIDTIKLENVTFTFNKETAPGFAASVRFKKEMKNQGLIFLHVRNVNLKTVTMSGQEGDHVQFRSKDIAFKEEA